MGINPFEMDGWMRTDPIEQNRDPSGRNPDSPHAGLDFQVNSSFVTTQPGSDLGKGLKPSKTSHGGGEIGLERGFKPIERK